MFKYANQSLNEKNLKKIIKCKLIDYENNHIYRMIIFKKRLNVILTLNK